MTRIDIHAAVRRYGLAMDLVDAGHRARRRGQVYDAHVLFCRALGYERRAIAKLAPETQSVALSAITGSLAEIERLAKETYCGKNTPSTAPERNSRNGNTTAP